MGVFEIFVTSRDLRKLGSLAMSTGLAVFGFTGLYAVLHEPLAGNSVLPDL